MMGWGSTLLCRTLAVTLITSSGIAHAADCALVATGGFDAVTVVDLATGNVTAQIPARERTVGVTVSADGRMAFAANNEDNSVSVIDLVEGAAIATIPVGMSPTDLAAHPDLRHVYVTDRNSNRVSMIDLVAGAVVRTIATGGGPSGIVITGDGRIGYTANFLSSTVSVLDLVNQRPITAIGVGQQPFDVALSPDESRLYVTAVTTADVTVIDTATRTVVTTIPVGGFPARVAVHPSGTFAYVTDTPEGGITVIDTQQNRVLTSFLLSEEGTLNAASVAMTADGATAVVPEYVFGNVYLIDTASHAVRSFHPLGSSSAAPEGIAVATLPNGCPTPPTPRLTADLSATDTEMRVDRLDALPTVGTVRIDAELITYRGTFMGVVLDLVRGVRGTTPAVHAPGTIVFVIRPGDANCDTLRSAADLIAVVTDVVAGREPGPCGNDANEDRVVDANDIAATVSAIFGG